MIIQKSLTDKLGELGTCISDLFFNSAEINDLDNSSAEECVHWAATEWLELYPYFQQYITADDLTQDFLSRI